MSYRITQFIVVREKSSGRLSEMTVTTDYDDDLAKAFHQGFAKPGNDCTVEHPNYELVHVRSTPLQKLEDEE